MTATWVQLSPGEYERQFEHAYYRVHHNLVTGMWHLGRRLDPSHAIKVVGVYGTYRECREAAERREASL